MLSNKYSLVTLLAFVFLSPTTKAQAITTNDLIEAWDIMTEMVIESAKLMPADSYLSTPVNELRNFADQLNHTSGANIGFGYAVNAGEPEFELPDRNTPLQSKKDVITLLENSFKYFRCGLESLSQDDLEETILWGRQGNQTEITRLKGVLIVISHLQREHGKTILYLRDQGITPPPSGSWSF